MRKLMIIQLIFRHLSWRFFSFVLICGVLFSELLMGEKKFFLHWQCFRIHTKSNMGLDSQPTNIETKHRRDFLPRIWKVLDWDRNQKISEFFFLKVAPDNIRKKNMSVQQWLSYQFFISFQKYIKLLYQAVKA